MKYLVQPLTSNNQSAPGVSPGQGFRIYTGNQPGILPLQLRVDGKGNLVTGVASDDQRNDFRLEALAGDALGYFRIHHLASGKFVTVPGGSKSVGAQFQVQGWTGAQSQQFEVAGADDKACLKVRHSGMAVSIAGASTAAGARIVQATWAGATHQWWYVIAKFAADGRPMVLANVHHGKPLAEVNGRPQIVPWREGDAEQWRLDALAGERAGYYRVTNVATGNALTVELGPYGYGPSTTMAPWSDGLGQRFLLLDLGGGRATLVSAFNKKALAPMDGRLYEVNQADDARQQWQVGLLKPAKATDGLTATVYEHYGYQGASQALGPGFWNLAELTLINDTISSLRVPPGLRVTLYEHRNFAGAKRIYEADAPQLVDFNDKTSSILVELVATIYADRDFQGARQTVGVGRYRASNLQIGNDALSSLQVPPGLLVTLFEHDDYKGRGWTYIEDTKWTGALNDKVSSLLVEPFGVAVPPGTIRYGGAITLHSHLKKFLHDSPTYLRADGAVGEKFTVIRAGGSKYRSILAFGDLVRLRASNGLYLTAMTDDNARLVVELTGSSAKQQVFRVVRASGTRHNDLVARGDMIALRCAATDKYLVGEANGDANINRTAIGTYERWVVHEVTLPPGVSPDRGASVCAAEACGADSCGTAACGAEAAVIGICGAAVTAIGVCGADVCGAAGCAAAACAAAACVVAGSVFAACGSDACAGDLCGVAACGAAISGFGVCGADACAVAACGAAVTAIGLSLVNACGAALGGISGCPIDVCGANACGINMCPIDACGADACGLDVFPIIPGI